MPKLGHLACGPTARGQALGTVVGARFIVLDQYASIGLPKA